MERRTTVRVVGALALSTLGACNASYAPPIRATHYGMPGRLSSGQGEVAVAAAIPDTHGSASVALPVARRLTVEGTYDGAENFHVGSAGLRGTIPLGGPWSLDLEGGLGAGVGGERCGNNPDVTQTCAAGQADGLGAFDRFAFGGYLGAGVGLRPWRVAGFFVRARTQVSSATGAPVTGWGSAVAGVEFRAGPVRPYLAGGGYVLTNSAQTESNGIIELGLSVPFTVWR